VRLETGAIKIQYVINPFMTKLSKQWNVTEIADEEKSKE
jgi:hypothetical protein